MDSKKRSYISMAGSVLFHLLLFVTIACTGLLHTTAAQDDIVEVSLYGGGGSGGGGGQGGDDSDTTVEEAEQDFGQEDGQEADVDQDTITDNSNKSFPSPQKATTAKRPVAKNATDSGGGHGTGHGTGTGSGTGPGSGSGSGGGHGSGHGTGTGSGIGPGSGGGYGGGIAANPAVPPRIVRSPNPAYPAAQRNAGIEGTVLVRLLIDKNGNVESASVSRSSGDASLDAAASSACGRWRFTPAKDSYGRAVRCYATVPVTFRLK